MAYLRRSVETYKSRSQNINRAANVIASSRTKSDFDDRQPSQEYIDSQMKELLIGRQLSMSIHGHQENPVDMKERRLQHQLLAKESSKIIKAYIDNNRIPPGTVQPVKEILSQSMNDTYSNLVILKCGHTVYSKSIYQSLCPHCK